MKYYLVVDNSDEIKAGIYTQGGYEIALSEAEAEFNNNRTLFVEYKNFQDMFNDGLSTYEISETEKDFLIKIKLAEFIDESNF